MKRLLLALGLATTFLVLSPSQALACSCVMSTLAQQAQRADVVVSGVVTPADQSDTTSTFHVAVDSSYKGPRSGQLTFRTSSQGAACGLGELATDKRYLLMLDRSGDQLSATSCGGTVPWTSTAASVVAHAVGPARTTTAGATGSAAPGGSKPGGQSTGQSAAKPAGQAGGLGGGLVGGGVLIVLVGGIALTLRRRARLG